MLNDILGAGGYTVVSVLVASVHRGMVGMGICRHVFQFQVFQSFCLQFSLLFISISIHIVAWGKKYRAGPALGSVALSSPTMYLFPTGGFPNSPFLPLLFRNSGVLVCALYALVWSILFGSGLVRFIA